MERTTKKGFNVIDAVIILLVLACIAGTVVRYGLADKISESSQSTNVEIGILFEDLSPIASSAFVKDDVFYWEGINIGTCKSIDVQKAVAYIADENGQCKRVEREDKCNVKIVLSASGTYTDSGFMLSGTTYLAPGKRFEVYSLNICSNGLITEIVEVNQ